MNNSGVHVSTQSPVPTPENPVRMLSLRPLTVPLLYQEVYWLKLLQYGHATPAIQYAFLQLKPKIFSLHPYKFPLDHVHCTMNVTDDPDCPYTNDWDEHMAELRPKIICKGIYCGKEGVAAKVELTEWQQRWYQLGSTSVPHVTLAVGHGQEARSLGPMIKRALTTRWVSTTDPMVMKAATEDLWWFKTPATVEHTLRFRGTQRIHPPPRSPGYGGRHVVISRPHWLQPLPHSRLCQPSSSFAHPTG